MNTNQNWDLTELHYGRDNTDHEIKAGGDIAQLIGDFESYYDNDNSEEIALCCGMFYLGLCDLVRAF